MRLYLFRHGVPVDPSRWDGSDQDRPLVPEGEVEVGAVARKLLLTEPPLAAILHSPYLRTQHTATILGAILGVKAVSDPGLASGADLTRWVEKKNKAGTAWPDPLMLVGHQPDLGLLIGGLIGDPQGGYGLGRAGVACLEGPALMHGSMKLKWLREAREILRKG